MSGVSDSEKEAVLSATQAASKLWKDSFNSGNAAGCAAQYESTALMEAKPFGTFKGTEEIQGFWQKLIDDGFSEVEYVEATKLEVVSADSVVLSSNWKMNKAKGVITKELWVLQGDGTAKLREDHFEAQG
ncbi:expressed unknown protein [Seminavis robusta]|uniref:Isochorismatase n=1 Tax=Seminavis robusta TaxID=568900 RepID=A0A9N8E6B9_9STRA|nr:expressed unknown protein [Seminavis robusta]|eukprot:Sro668_g184330.1 n/a (130) ;mRNA; f:22930-23319